MQANILHRGGTTKRPADRKRKIRICPGMHLQRPDPGTVEQFDFYRGDLPRHYGDGSWKKALIRFNKPCEITVPTRRMPWLLDMLEKPDAKNGAAGDFLKQPGENRSATRKQWMHIWFTGPSSIRFMAREGRIHTAEWMKERMKC